MFVHVVVIHIRLIAERLKLLYDAFARQSYLDIRILITKKILNGPGLMLETKCCIRVTAQVTKEFPGFACALRGR